MKVVMYHYVQAYSNEYPNLKFLNFEDFKRQLSFFEKKFGLITFDDWSRFVSGDSINLGNKILLTFDDALRCHAKYVVPELLQRGAVGLFFTPTQPFLDGGTILNVHKIHLLCGKFPANLLLNCALDILENREIQGKSDYDEKTNPYRNQNNETDLSSFKKLINYVVHPEEQTYFLDLICKKVKFKPNHKDFYLSEDELFEFKQKNMIIGFHGFSHRLMANLDERSQRDEFEKSEKFISKFTVKNHKCYSHPFGGFDSFNSKTLNILEEFGYNYAFNVESSDFYTTTISRERFHIPRYDCNEFPFGSCHNESIKF